MAVYSYRNYDSARSERQALRQLDATKRWQGLMQAGQSEMRDIAARRKFVAKAHFPLKSTISSGKLSGTVESVEERTGLLVIRLSNGRRTTCCPLQLIESQSEANP